MDQIFTNIDNIILSFVQGSFGALTSAVQSFWTLMFTVFVAFYGYKIFMTGKFSASDLVTHCIKLLLVLALATQWNVFFMFVYNLVTNLPSDIAGQIMQAASNSLGTQSQAATVASANTALGQFYDKSMTVYSNLLEGAGIEHFSLYIYAGAVWVGALLFTGYAAMLIILAKLAVAVILAVGPVFILLLIFHDSRKLFEGWLRTLLNFAVVPIFVYGLLALLLAITAPPLAYLQTHSGVYDQLATAVGPFLATTFIAMLLLQQVMNIAANITGGVSLTTMGGPAQALGVFAAARNIVANSFTESKAFPGHAKQGWNNTKTRFNALRNALGKRGGTP